MSGDDGMSFSTRVPVAMHAWAPMVMSCSVCIKWFRFPRILALGSLVCHWEPPGMDTGAQVCAEPDHKEELVWGKRDWCRLLLDSVLFRLVVPLLQLGVVGPYPVRGVWFPNRLPLEGIRPYPDLLGYNQRPTVLRVQGPDSSPRAFR
jgi:hypothetical protein